MANTFAQSVKAFLILITVPVVSWLIGIGLGSFWEMKFTSAVLASPAARAQHITAEQLEPLRDLCSRNPVNLQSVCGTYGNIQILRNAGFWSGIAGLAVVGIVWLAARACRGNRDRLALIFGYTVRILLTLICVLIFVQGGLLTYAAYLAEGTLIRTVHLQIILALGFGTLGASAAIVQAAYSLGDEFTATAIGLAASEDEQPALWSFVKGIATKIGATPPKQIVLGLEPTFYVTAADVTLAGTTRFLSGNTMASHVTMIKSVQRISGETMYLSVPLMRILSREEFAAVVGHELGHFKGQDTIYTLRFVPVYRGIVEALQNLSSVTINAMGQLLAVPPAIILSFCLNEFAKAERDIGRMRELEADRAGAEASGAGSIVSSLVKVGAFTPIWPQLCQASVNALNEGKAFSNMSRSFAEAAKQARNTANIEQLQKALMTSEQSHPTDTHPTLETRARALNIAMTDFAAYLKMDDEPASSLIADVETLEESLSHQLQRLFIERGYAHPPPPQDTPHAPEAVPPV